jgi:hypothetical protein
MIYFWLVLFPLTVAVVSLLSYVTFALVNKGLELISGKKWYL